MENNNDDRVNQNMISNSKINKIDSLLYNFHQVCRSVCKILISNRKGSGFFMKLTKRNHPLYCLMTCEHVIKMKELESKKDIKITIYYDNENEFRVIDLNKEKRFIRDFLYMNIDAIIIQIIEEDYISDNFF